MIPDDLNQMLRAYMESRAALTALELDIFSAVGSASTADDVARKISTDQRATEILLNALVAMRLLTKEDGIFHNTPTTARYFVEGSEDNSRPGLLHIANLWRRWSTLTECVRTGTSAGQQASNEPSDHWTRDFIAAMDYNAHDRAPLVVEAVGVEGIERLLDVGGGSAAYSIAFARASNDLHATVLDQASVVPIAQGHIRNAGLTGRVNTRIGDLRHDPLGSGFDLVLVSAVCHMLGPEENRDLLRRCFEALAPGGRLVIQEFILESDKTSPKQAALFALNMLVGTLTGNSYSADEYQAWMLEAGFEVVNRISLPAPSSLMVGSKQ